MDPDQALSDLRESLSEDADGLHQNLTLEQQAERYRAARDAFWALDEWITTGGFLPREWRGRGPRK